MRNFTVSDLRDHSRLWIDDEERVVADRIDVSADDTPVAERDGDQRRSQIDEVRRFRCPLDAVGDVVRQHRLTACVGSRAPDQRGPFRSVGCWQSRLREDGGGGEVEGEKGDERSGRLNTIVLLLLSNVLDCECAAQVCNTRRSVGDVGEPQPAHRAKRPPAQRGSTATARCVLRSMRCASSAPSFTHAQGRLTPVSVGGIAGDPPFGDQRRRISHLRSETRGAT